jgi:hypothetical protein
MHHRVLFVGALVISACAQQRFAAEESMQSSATPDQTFQCVRKQFDSLGYKRTSLDTDARRVNGTKIDEKTRRADTQFRRMLNKLEVEVSPEANGQTSLKVTGRTIAEYTTQRGPTEVEEKASADVRSATQTLLERCRS